MSRVNSTPAGRNSSSIGKGSTVSRRTALGQLAWLGAVVGLPRSATAVDAPSLPDESLFDRDPERFWTKIRSEQFLLGDDRIFLNPGSLGVAPRPVLEAMTDSINRAAAYETDDIVRWGYETMDADRSEMAEFLGCSKDELAFTHNCTEAMSTIANGLDLKAGDEIILTDQEHGGGSACWRLKAARTGVVVREVEIPLSPRSPEELLERLVKAIGPRTRVLSFSGITSPTGLILPSRELCRAARDKGVICVLDGAHMDGQIPVDLREIGCDYFAGSPHKWLFAPAGCGLLYGRDDSLDRIWPCIATAGWDNKKELHAGRFMMVGTNNRATFDGMMAGLRFFKRLGPERIYARTHQLARLVLEQARQRKYLELITTDDSRLFHAMVSFRCSSTQFDPLRAALRKKKICAIVGERFRISTHIHARPSDIQQLFQECDRYLGA